MYVQFNEQRWFLQPAVAFTGSNREIYDLMNLQCCKLVNLACARRSWPAGAEAEAGPPYSIIIL